MNDTIASLCGRARDRAPAVRETHRRPSFLPTCLVALLVCLAGCSYSPEGDARWQARKAVKARLASPGSAKLVQDAVLAHTKDHAFYVVYLVMDSQNKFGAMQRSHHLALMQTNGSEKVAEPVTISSYEKSPPMSKVREFQFMGTDWVDATVAAPAR